MRDADKLAVTDAMVDAAAKFRHGDAWTPEQDGGDAMNAAWYRMARSEVRGMLEAALSLAQPAPPVPADKLTCPRCAAIDQHKRDSRAGSGSSVEDGGLWEDRALAAEADAKRLREIIAGVDHWLAGAHGMPRWAMREWIAKRLESQP